MFTSTSEEDEGDLKRVPGDDPIVVGMYLSPYDYIVQNVKLLAVELRGTVFSQHEKGLEFHRKHCKNVKVKIASCLRCVYFYIRKIFIVVI